MAPHDTDTPKEARRHAAPLIGMGLAVALVLGGFVWWIAQASEGADSDNEVTEETPSAPGASEPEN